MIASYFFTEVWRHCCRFASPTTSGMQRRWHDGSLENDLPFRQLAEMFNVNHFIVSQTNPHLVPLMTLKTLVPGPVFNMVKAEVKHAFAQVRAMSHDARLSAVHAVGLRRCELLKEVWPRIFHVMPSSQYQPNSDSWCSAHRHKNMRSQQQALVA